MSSINRRLMIAAAAAMSLAACNQLGGGKAGAGTLGDEVAIGDPKAKVTVVEYASASCTHCARFDEEVFPAFKAKYIDTGKVRYVFREFLTPPAQVAAAGFLMARCAGNGTSTSSVLDAVFQRQKEMFRTGDVRGACCAVAQARHDRGSSSPPASPTRRRSRRSTRGSRRTSKAEITVHPDLRHQRQDARRASRPWPSSTPPSPPPRK